MTRPGGWLRRATARVFSATTMSRLIDPILADLQTEYGEAIGQGRKWRAQWIRLVHVVGLMKAVGLYVGGTATGGGTAEDRRALRRTAIISAATAAGVVALIVFHPMFVRARDGVPSRLFVYLIPSAVPTALAVAITMGVLLGVGRSAVSRQLAWATVLFALGVSLASFVIGAWVAPPSNQTFRVHTYAYVAGYVAPGYSPPPGLAELTFGELASRAERARSIGGSGHPYSLEYHARYARAAAPLVLGVFSLCLVTSRRRVQLALAILAAYCVPLLYYFSMMVGRSASRGGQLSPAIGAWLPNILFAVVTIPTIALRRHERDDRDISATSSTT